MWRILNEHDIQWYDKTWNIYENVESTGMLIKYQNRNKQIQKAIQQYMFTLMWQVKPNK
jgi:hypothetical protein